MSSPSDQIIPREEWDFRGVADDELFPCLWWEYARESGRIRAFYQPEDSDFFPTPNVHPEIRRSDGSIATGARRLSNLGRMRFIETIREHALPLKLTMDRARNDGLEQDTLDHPWQSLPKLTKRGVVDDLAPYLAEKPALTFLPFNRCSDLRDMGIADDHYLCAEFDEKTGIERFRAQIDWAGFTDEQIVESFRHWVHDNRPSGVGRANDRGKRKGPGLEAQLKSLGILRLMNVSTVRKIEKHWPDAWGLYHSMDWPRARKHARLTFRELYFFLPECDLPLHWPTAGRRAK